ncbi:MAG: FAD-dependent oxidoreductase [Dehalococcoidia bacterium]
MIRATITGIQQATPSIRVFTLDTGGHPFDYRPGQWLDLYAEVDGRTQIGGYSITSSPLRRGTVEIAVKRAENHPVTRFLHERIGVGDTVQIDGGYGDCTLDVGAGIEVGAPPALLLVAGGIGITPLASMVRYASEALPDAAVTLLHSAPTPDEHLFRAEFEALAARWPLFRPEFWVTQATDVPPGTHRGRIDAAGLGRAVGDLEGRGGAPVCYLCGPRSMIDEVAADLGLLGVAPERIRFERWW